MPIFAARLWTGLNKNLLKRLISSTMNNNKEACTAKEPVFLANKAYLPHLANFILCRNSWKSLACVILNNHMMIVTTWSQSLCASSQKKNRGVARKDMSPKKNSGNIRMEMSPKEKSNRAKVLLAHKNKKIVFFWICPITIIHPQNAHRVVLSQHIIDYHGSLTISLTLEFFPLS